MTPLAIALVVAVLALLWFAAKPNTTNHAEQDDKATSRGVQHGSTRASHERINT